MIPGAFFFLVFVMDNKLSQNYRFSFGISFFALKCIEVLLRFLHFVNHFKRQINEALQIPLKNYLFHFL